MDYKQRARYWAEHAGIDPEVFVRQIQQESNFNPLARSPAGALGIAQFMPATGRQYGLMSEADLFDPDKSLQASALHMRDLLDQNDGDMRLALAGYNAGQGAVQKHGGVPPFPETQNYVSKIYGDGGQLVQDPRNYHAALPAAPGQLPTGPLMGGAVMGTGAPPSGAAPFTGLLGQFQTPTQAFGSGMLQGAMNPYGAHPLAAGYQALENNQTARREFGLDLMEAQSRTAATDALGAQRRSEAQREIAKQSARNQVATMYEAQGQPDQAAMVRAGMADNVVNQTLWPQEPDPTAAQRNYEYLIAQGVDPETARGQTFGSGGVTVNMPGSSATGSVQPGYTRTIDPSGQAVDQPIPGTPEFEKRQKADRATAASLRAVERMKELLDEHGEGLDLVGNAAVQLEMKQLHDQIMTAIGQLNNAGVMEVGDIARIKQTIPDPTERFTLRGVDAIKAAFDVVGNRVRRASPEAAAKAEAGKAKAASGQVDFVFDPNTGTFIKP